MSQNHCPLCKGDQLTSNGGAEGHTGVHGAHFLMEGIKHGSFLKIGVGTIAIAVRALNPKKLTCQSCGHVFKA